MPEITLTLFGLLAAMLALGFVLGWILRGGRIAREKTAINASWQEQMNAQKTEHDRLADQNKSLMEQISEYRASKKDSDLRAKELSSSLKEAFEKRDELQRQLKDVRSELDVKVAQRNKLRTDLERNGVKIDAANTALKDKDNKIFKLSRELESWKGRLPPLIERFRLRDLEAQEVEIELEKARSRLADLESPGGRDETRIEPVDHGPIADGLDASNDQYEETSEHAIAALDDIDTENSEEDEANPAYNEDNDAESGQFTGRFDAQEDEDSTGSHLQSEAQDESPEADADGESGEFSGRFEARDDDDDTGSHLHADSDDEAHDDESDDDSDDLSGRFDARDDDDDTGSHLHADSDDGAHDDDTDDDSDDLSGRFEARDDDDDTGSHLHADSDDEAHDADSDDDSDDLSGRFEARDDDDDTGSHLHADSDDEAHDADSDDDSDDLSGRFEARDDDDDTGSHLHADSDDEAHDDDSDDLSGRFEARDDEEASPPPATNGAGGPAASKDDLQKIKGVGPAIEKTLNGLGFYRFRQIAEMSEYDIDRVARELRGFRSRIYREDWIGQARMLQVGKSGTYTT